MAAVVTVDGKDARTFDASPGAKLVIAGVAGDSSYPTGGYAVTAANFGLGALHGVWCAPSVGYVGEYVAGKIKLYVTKDPAAAGGANIVLQEVGNTVDVSAIVAMQVIAIGTY